MSAERRTQRAAGIRHRPDQISGHQGKSQHHGGGDVKGVGSSDTELAGEPGGRPREGVVDGDETKPRKPKDGINGPARQPRLARSACNRTGHLGQEQGRGDQPPRPR